MKKPKVVTKTYLRDNLARINASVVNDKNREVWIMDKGNISTVLIDANRYESVYSENRKLKAKISEYETLMSLYDYKKGEYTEHDSIEDLLSDLDKNENSKNKKVRKNV